MLKAKYYKDNFRLAYPLVLSFLGQSIVQLFDTLMVGQLGREALAGVAFASAITTIALVFGQGIGMSLTPLVGQSFARGETKRISLLFQNAISLNFLAGCFIIAVLMAFVPLMHSLGQPEEVVVIAKPYFIITALSLFSAQIFLSFRHFMEGVGNTKVTMAIIISANVLNIALNYVFIFGKLGFAPMGAFGAGLSTCIARTLMPIAYVIYLGTHAHYRKYFKFFRRGNFSLHIHKSLIRIGLPIAAQLSFECISFSTITVMMGWCSTIALAAYQIVVTFVTLTFQMACGIASATTILVSHSFGRGDAGEVSDYSVSGLHLSFLIMGVSACCFMIFGRQICTLFTDDAAVIAQGVALFVVAGAFQLLDGAQATILGALRGMNDVAKPMKYSFLCYICVAIPLAYVAGFVLNLGAGGILSGLVLGLGSAALLYYLRLRRNIRKQLRVE